MNQLKIGEIVANDFRSAAVFEKFGIDFCCKGNRSVEEACASRKINPEQVYLALEGINEPTSKESPDYKSWPLDQLCDHIEKKHHHYISEITPVLQQFLEKLCKVHGVRHPELFEINDLFNESAGELAMHMKKEELILFPYVRNMVLNRNHPQAMVSMDTPVRVLTEDHNREGERFEQISELTFNFTPPPDGCTTYKVAYQMLKEFESDLHLHIHLENNILFPGVFNLEQQKLNEQANQTCCINPGFQS